MYSVLSLDIKNSEVTDFFLIEGFKLHYVKLKPESEIVTKLNYGQSRQRNTSGSSKGGKNNY